MDFSLRMRRRKEINKVGQKKYKLKTKKAFVKRYRVVIIFTYSFITSLAWNTQKQNV